MQTLRSDGLFISLWAALSLAASAQAAVSVSPAWALTASLFWMAVHGWGLWYARNRQAPPPKRLGESVAVLGLIVFLFGLLWGNVVQALMSLLLWLQAARNPAVATRRDIYFALAISFTLILFGAAETKSGWFVALLVMYGLAALAVLMYCHQQSGREAELADNASRMQLVAQQAQGNNLSLLHLATLAGLVFALALAWYLVIPRPDPVHFGIVALRGGDEYARADWENEARNAQQPSTHRQDPRNKKSDTPRQQNNTSQVDDTLDMLRSRHGDGEQNPNGIVMYLQADRPLYLRRRSFEYFENNRWQSRRNENPSQARKLLPDKDTGKFELPAPKEGRDINYVVHVVAAADAGLPLSAHAKTLAAPVSVIALATDGTVFLPEKMKEGFRYSATSVLSRSYDRPVAHDALGAVADYLQLPAQDIDSAAAPTITPRIAELAGNISATASTPLGKALAFENHLRTSYAYSFATIYTSQNVTPLDEFLFVTKRGHCEFFASAMAIMLREIGIASRVVHGYLAHNYNPITGFYEVRALDGHAWVEAYIDGVGWMTFEPTAAYPMPQSAQRQSTTTLEDLKDYAEKLSQQETKLGQAGFASLLAGLLRELSDMWRALLFHGQLFFDSLRDWMIAHAGLVLAALLSSAALAALAYRQRAALRWRWAKIVLRATPAKRVALSALRQLECVARVAPAGNLGRQAGESVEEYVTRLIQTCPPCRAELHLLTKLFNAARYDGVKTAEDEAQSALRAFNAVGNALVARPG